VGVVPRVFLNMEMAVAPQIQIGVLAHIIS
jgi:hypothetical protein